MQNVEAYNLKNSLKLNFSGQTDFRFEITLPLGGMPSCRWHVDRWHVYRWHACRWHCDCRVWGCDVTRALLYGKSDRHAITWATRSHDFVPHSRGTKSWPLINDPSKRPQTEKIPKNAKGNHQKLIMFEGLRPNGLQIRNQRIFYIGSQRSKFILATFEKMLGFET